MNHRLHTMGRRALLTLGTVLALAGAPASLHAQPDLSQAVGPTLADRPSTTHRFESFELDSADGQRRYRVQLAIPLREAPAAGFPVLYLLDGNAAFAALREQDLQAQDAAGTPLAIAAIGYATPLRFDVTARAFDYTPRLPGPAPTMDDSANERPGGGADVFLDLIETRIRPQVHARLRADTTREAIWGHSYGGLLVLHALWTRPAAFATYIAADPSLWWHQGFILQEERQAIAPPSPTRRLLVLTGRNAPERVAAPNAEGAVVARMRQARQGVPPDAARALVARQQARPGLQAALRELEGMGHGPMLAASLPHAVALAAGTAAP